MPVYDYFCIDCGAFREMARMADWALDQPCPHCAAPAKRLLTTPFFADRGDTADAPPQRGLGAASSWRHMCGFGCRHCSSPG